MPQWRFKQWHKEGWIKVADFLNQKGFSIVLTGGTQAEERMAIKEIRQSLPASTTDCSGKLSLAELTALIGGAALFIGPDTGTTHLAAATGIPTIAIFGPTDPRKWAPWPAGYAKKSSPFASIGMRRVNNVSLVQGSMPQGCVPCQLEGCDRHRQSFSACLDGISAETVIACIQQII